jgi:thiol:disulfide interchange protein
MPANCAAIHRALKTPEPGRLLLTKHQPAHVGVSKILEEALARAKAEKKQVFLHFGAPWCIWCRRLDAWREQPGVARIIEKAFVETKIDMDRNDGSKEVAARFPGATDGGLPWLAFLDADGNVVSDLTGPKGNVGFPQTPEEIDLFESVLKRSRLLEGKDIHTLRITLEKKPLSSSE